jgi:dihydroflavonol-4-reductase
MVVVVTGAAGHLGGNLVRALLDRGRRVRALVHQDRRALEGLDLEIVEGDVRDPRSLQRALEGAEVVYHTAAHISLLRDEWPLLEAVNVLGTRNVVEACLSSGVRRLVHFSSIHALQEPPPPACIDESCSLVAPSGCPPYDRSKAAGEREVLKGMERGLDAVILIPTAFIGPYDFRPSHFGEALLAMGRGKLPALVQGGYDWVDVRDVTQGALAAEERAPTGARYLLSGHWVSLREVAAMVEEITGTSAGRLIFPIWLARMGAPFATAFARRKGKRPLYTSASLKALCSHRMISHLRSSRDLDYHPRPFRDTLVDTLRWFAETGHLAALPQPTHYDPPRREPL